MKSQDILLLLKLVSLEHKQLDLSAQAPSRLLLSIPDDWRGWQSEVDSEPSRFDPGEWFSMRALEDSTGISKSEVSGALKRCIEVGLAKLERKTYLPRANTKALYEFIVYGLKYVFPARPGAIVRGIPTAHAAPVLAGKLLSAGEFICVWEDAHGKQQGQTVAPLFKTVPLAVRKDAELYAMLALVDAIRIGQEREAGVAKKMLEQYLRRTN